MGVGRFFCVALPFALTIGSIIFLLVAALSGVADKSLYVFRVNVANLTISPASVGNIADKVTSRAPKTENITATDLGLSNYYDISIWGYCEVGQDGKRHCEKPKFDWAADSLNATRIENLGKAAGADVELPKEVKNSLKAFTKVSKWTEVAYIISFIALALQVVLGFVANCSRIASCLTWLVSGLSVVFVGAAAGMSTAMAAIVTGAIEGTAKYYGVKAHINTRFLSIVWIAFALALASAFFWVFTICCCAPDRRSKPKNRRSTDGEKLIPTGGYAPLGNDNEMSPANNGGYYNSNQAQTQYGAPRYPSGVARSDLAYEPYSHRA